jgi:ABC-type multidrug transport system fused ATPase/permease subunit
MALVEPHIFSGTFAENIGYGVRIDLDVPMADIIEAAKEANLDSFVSTLPEVRG